MKKQFLFLALLAATVICTPAKAGQQKNIAVGDIFSAVRTEYSFSNEELAYFGIERGFFSLFTSNRIALADINADIILVEFFNIYCTSCQSQAPVLNQVYKAVQKNPALTKKVRFIGVGAGNNEREVSQFKDRQEVPFPLIPDQRFSLYNALGETGGTPFMLILKKRGTDAVVVGIHKGLTKNTSFFINTLTTAAEQDIGTLTKRVTEQDIPRDDSRQLKLHLSQKQILEHVSKSMTAGCPDCGPISDLKQFTTASGSTLFTSKVEFAGKPLTLYSKLISQQPVCDVCHGLHYIVTFDSKGYLRDFYPIHITKYGNNDWNEYDIENMRKQLIGKRVNKELIFDPTPDAITSATMSSALIYKGVNELKPIYKELD